MVPHNISVAVTKRSAANPGYYTHDKVTEIQYVLSGSGTYATGGTLVDPVRYESPEVGPGLKGAVVKDGQTIKVGPGDVIVNAPGSPHTWIEIREPVVYLTFRVDPGKILQVKSSADE